MLPADATIETKDYARTTHPRRKVEDIEYKEHSIVTAPDEGAGTGCQNRPTVGMSLPQVVISEEAYALARQVIDALGPMAINNTIEVGAPAHCQKWINEGWSPEFCL